MPNGFMGRILRVNLTDRTIAERWEDGRKSLSAALVWPPAIFMTRSPGRLILGPAINLYS